MRITSLSYEAVAWRDASGKVHLALDKTAQDQSKPRVKSPISKNAPFAFADVNRDGYLDAFVGMPSLPVGYPLSEGSQFYFGNKDGIQKAVTSHSLSKLGNVHDCAFADFDGDGWVDLIVACDWSPIRFFKNNKGQLEEETNAFGFLPYKGWWNAVSVFDADNDGDLDLAAGNWGEIPDIRSFSNTRCVIILAILIAMVCSKDWKHGMIKKVNRGFP